ncbi:MerR family transcriptional regulator, partial [Escherichia coli]
MAYYSIGDVAERCGINPVTLRAWQRRYGLLKPQRSEGGHRLFDEEDIQRIEEIKRWISNGVPVGKVKALLETTSQDTEDDWSRLQEEMMSILRMANPAKLRARIISLGREYPVDQLINHVYLPVRQRLVLDHNTSRIMSSMFDGALIEYAALMNPLMILVKIIKLRWIHILSYDQMVSRKINNQTTRCANS